MSNIDRKYIEALDTFTSALEEIVETLKSQKKTADPVNQFLKTPMGDLNKVVTELKTITEKGFSDLKNQNETILKKIESIKQQKESGMFGNIEDPKNKNKIVDGIKVVMLIAGGVLALGLAFKIIGKVDFLSVMALSGAILIMSVAFSKISDQKLKFAEVFKISLALPIMALSLAMSGMMLKGFPTFTIGQGLSILIIGGSLGIASLLLLKSLSQISLKSLLFVPLLPFILPLIAKSLVKASSELSNIKHIKDPMKLVKDSFAIGLSVLAFAPTILILGKMKLADIIQGIIGIYFLSDAIVSVALKFKELPTVMRHPDFMWSLGVGLSLLVFVPTVYILGKMKLEDIVQGIIGIHFLSSAIVSVALKFQKLPTVMRHPDFMWSLGVGLSLLVFVPTVYILGKMPIEDILLGIIALPLVAYAIVITSKIFNGLPNEMKYPSFIWTLGAGLSILAFGLMAVGLGLIFTATGGLAALGMAGALLAIMAVAGTIVATSYILGLGKYDKFPSLEWAAGVGLALLSFSVAVVAASVAGLVGAVGSLFTGGEDPLLRIARSMVDISWFLQLGKWNGNYPSLKWSSGVGTALLLFAGATVISAGAGFASKILSFFTDDTDPLMTLAKSMVDVSFAIQKGKYDGNYPSLDWATNVGTAMALFAAITVGSGVGKLATKILGFFSGDKDPLMSLAQSMVDLSFKLQEGQWKQSLSSIKIIVSVIEELNKIKIDSSLLSKMTTIKDSITELMSGIDSFMYESNNNSLLGMGKRLIVGKTKRSMTDFTLFSMGLSTIISSLKIMSALTPMRKGIISSYVGFLNEFKKMPDMKQIDVKAVAIGKLANSFLILANSLSSVNQNLQGFSNLSKGLFLISIIDDKKFNNVLKSVDKYKSTLQLVNQIPEDQVNLLAVIKGLYETGTNKGTNETVIAKQTADNTKQTQFYNDISDIRNLLYDMKDTLIKPSETGSFNK